MYNWMIHRKYTVMWMGEQASAVYSCCSLVGNKRCTEKIEIAKGMQRYLLCKFLYFLYICARVDSQMCV